MTVLQLSHGDQCTIKKGLPQEPFHVAVRCVAVLRVEQRQNARHGGAVQRSALRRAEQLSDDLGLTSCECLELHRLSICGASLPARFNNRSCF